MPRSPYAEANWRELYEHLEGHTFKNVTQNAHEILYDLFQGRVNTHYQLNRDLVVVLTMKERAMAVRKDLPDPTKGQAEWISQMVDLDGVVNMRDYRDYPTKDKRLWMVEGARKMSAALHAKMLEVELTPIGNDKVNCYRATDDCKAFWKNGREQNMSDEEILNGWLAMMSMQEDVSPKE